MAAYSHCDSGPASSPTRVTAKPSSRNQAIKSFRLARHLGLPDDPPGGIHDAHTALFQRNVDPGIVLHGRPSMMLGAGLQPDPVHDTITLGDDHPRHPARRPARYPI